MDLWPHQKAALVATYDLIKQGQKRICITAPTGAGKTACAATVAMQAAKQGMQALFTAPKIVLVEQTLDAFAERTGLPKDQFGVLQASNSRNLDAPYIVGTPQTIHHRGLPQNVRVVIVDECHKRFDTLHKAIKAAQNPPTLIGLTATPYAPSMALDYDALVLCSTTDELVEKGVLCPAKLYAAEAIDTSGLNYNHATGDYGSASDIEDRTNDAVLDGMIERWREVMDRHFGGPDKTLAFSRSIQQGEKLVNRFRAEGYDFRQVHSGDDPVERHRNIEDYRSGRCLGLVSVDVLAEGFDVRDTRCVLFARPTKSLTRLVQAIGRGQRSCEGKDHCVVIDMSTSLRHRFGDLTAHWSVGPQGFAKPRKPSPGGIEKTKVCPNCNAIVPALSMKCPSCGYVWPEKEMKVFRGQLVALERANVAGMTLEELGEAARDRIVANRALAWGSCCTAAEALIANGTFKGDRSVYQRACDIWRDFDRYGALDKVAAKPSRWHIKKIGKTRPKGDLAAIAVELGRKGFKAYLARYKDAPAIERTLDALRVKYPQLHWQWNADRTDFVVKWLSGAASEKTKRIRAAHFQIDPEQADAICLPYEMGEVGMPVDSNRACETEDYIRRGYSVRKTTTISNPMDLREIELPYGCEARERIRQQRIEGYRQRAESRRRT